MKKIILLGDSCRMGYDSFVQKKLAGRAEVYYSEDNGRFIQYTLRSLSDWAGQGHWPTDADAVHWNNGLWDCLHLNIGSAGYADGEASGLTMKPENINSQCTFEKDPLTPPEFYRYYLVRTYHRIRQLFPQAVIVFATSTPVIEEQASWAYRSNAEIELYNSIARETLLPLGVKINELGDFAKNNCHDLHSDWVHYTDEGYAVIAEEIIRFLEEEHLL